MPYAPDRAAARFARDRDLLPSRAGLGPYELPYDVRRGYEQGSPRQSKEASRPDVLLFRAREDEPAD
ncbi:MAG TPA: hypothetical protein VFT45_01580 [Longimicrobium sp.]|nr:hypothetical protein [Longimicrobium sp.]